MIVTGIEYCVMKRSILFLIVGLPLLLTGCGGRLGRNVSVAGLDVSRMPVDEAAALVSAREAEKLQSFFVKLEANGETLEIPASELGAEALVDEAMRRAAQVNGREEKKGIAVEWRADWEAASRVAAEAAKSFGSEPVDAAVKTDFAQTEPFTFLPEEPGKRVDEDALTKRLIAAVESRVRTLILVPMEDVPAAVSAASLSEDRQLVSAFSTSFDAEPHNAANRVFNIVKAAKCINGLALKPGEVFDCNAVLGDRNEQNGWKEAPGIRNGAYVDEYGGGVCQVSSTLFNTALMADLTIVERHPHSWPMGYVDIGRDAAISTGGKNFRFVNSSGGTVYLSAIVDEQAGRLTVSVFGRPLPDGESIEITSERTGTLSEPDTLKTLDESLPAGTEVIARQARQGRTSKTYMHRKAADGTLLSTSVLYEDTYRSIDGLTYVSSDIYYS